MIYAILLFILFSFISYRLIGSDSSKGKTFLSSILSLLFSSAIYYIFHLQNSANNNFIQFDHFTFLYFITLIVVAMGFSLILEMMKDGKKVIQFKCLWVCRLGLERYNVDPCYDSKYEKRTMKFRLVSKGTIDLNLQK